MLACETVRPVVDREPRDPMKHIGSLSQAIDLLYPQLPLGIVSQASDLLEHIQDVCDTTMNGAELVLRGSSAKRLIYYTETGLSEPPGWNTPRKIWEELLKDEPHDSQEPYSLRTFIDRKPELDIVYQPRNNETFSVMEEQIAHDVLHLPVRVDSFQYSSVSLANICWPDNALTIQVHPFPRKDQLHDEARTSFYFIASEAFTGAFIRGRSVSVNTQDMNIFMHDKALFSFSYAVLEQAMVGYQRSRLNHIFFSLGKQVSVPPIRTIGGMFIDEKFQKEYFWREAREKSMQHPDHFATRQNEIMINNMLLLTCCPHLLFERCDRLYWNQFAVAHASIPESIFLPEDEYRRKFRDGSLTPEESGPAVLMKYFGFSKPSELLPLVTPQL